MIPVCLDPDVVMAAWPSGWARLMRVSMAARMDFEASLAQLNAILTGTA